MFANNETEVGRTNRTHFTINTKSNVPVAVKLRRTPFSLRSEVDKQIHDMEKRGIIEPSTSPYSSPILLVPKSDGTYRFCADFRALNDATITEVFPIPSVRKCLDSLKGSKLFTTLDLYTIRAVGIIVCKAAQRSSRGSHRLRQATQTAARRQECKG